MAQTMHCRASALLNLTDEYEAWCLDEAAATIAQLIKSGRKLRPKATKDNSALIEKLTEIGAIEPGTGETKGGNADGG